MAATVPFNGLADSGTKLIKEVTASSSSTVSFIHGTSDVVFDGTFDVYEFIFSNIHPATNDTEFGFKATLNGSDFGVATTATFQQDYLAEADSTPAGYTANASYDIAQGTGLVNIAHSIGNGNDECMGGRMIIYNPASTTFTKMFQFFTNAYHAADLAENYAGGGYVNTTSAVTGLQFAFSSGNIDTGTIKLIGYRT
jgi:hypothetical protein|tara:strand:- start:122 stop:712 length:591 start_codon:yes stop_codon:yes gene_type:complete